MAQLTGNDERITAAAGTNLAKMDDRLDILEVGENYSDMESDGGGKLFSIRLKELNRITKGTYNITDKMGSILKHKYKWITLTGIRRAYGSAFSEHTNAIDSALKDKSLDALSVVRNLLVHRSGVADRKYIEQSNGIPNAPKLGIGERLALDGEIVCCLVNPVIVKGVALIKAVDSYIRRP